VEERRGVIALGALDRQLAHRADGPRLRRVPAAHGDDQRADAAVAEREGDAGHRAATHDRHDDRQAPVDGQTRDAQGEGLGPRRARLAVAAGLAETSMRGQGGEDPSGSPPRRAARVAGGVVVVRPRRFDHRRLPAAALCHDVGP
jgi:hypothetical protein